MSDIILSYHDSLLRKSDCKLLRGNQWINDNIIEFYFEYLSNDLFKGKNLLAIGPSFAQLIKLTDSAEEMKELLMPLEIEKKDLVLIPINNHEDSTEAGGSHWSLLVLYVGSLKFEHYDSLMHSSNVCHAKQIAAKLNRLLRGDTLDLVIMTCNQQIDGYNCGIHVICNARAVCKKHFLHDTRHVRDIATEKAVRGCRDQLLLLIERLREEATAAAGELHQS